MAILEKIAENLQLVRRKKPLIHHITNYVTVNDCANITLALGASPVMADDVEEVEEMVSFASALVINIGTLNIRTVEAMIAAGKVATGRGIPVIFDPVGVGATKLRTAVAGRIIREVKPAVIRGNMSEMKFLAGLNVAIKGVDSVADERDGQAIAQELAKRLSCVITITGKRDIITDGTRCYYTDNGHSMLSEVTGTGCMTTSLIAGFCGAGSDWLLGTVAGITAMGIAGELAQQSLQPEEGTGTFRARLFDNISNLTAETMRLRAKVSVCEGFYEH